MLKVMFSVCLSVHTQEVTPSPSHNTSTGPMFFLRGTPWLVPGSFSGEYPSNRWGYLSNRQGVPQSHGGTPVPGGATYVLGYTPDRTGWCSPPPARTVWGTSPARIGWGNPPPQNRLCLNRLRHGWYASCSFPQEACLVTDHFWKVYGRFHRENDANNLISEIKFWGHNMLCHRAELG